MTSAILHLVPSALPLKKIALLLWGHMAKEVSCLVVRERDAYKTSVKHVLVWTPWLYIKGRWSHKDLAQEFLNCSSRNISSWIYEYGTNLLTSARDNCGLIWVCFCVCWGNPLSHWHWAGLCTHCPSCAELPVQPPCVGTDLWTVRK